MTYTKNPRFILPRLTFLELVEVALWTAFALIYQSICGLSGYQMAWNWLMDGQLLVGASALVVIVFPSLASIGMIYLLIGNRKKV